MSVAPGLRIGPNEILSRLGEGGLGEVWKARAIAAVITDAGAKLLDFGLARARLTPAPS